MKPVFLITIPHTGTMSLKKVFDDNGLEYRFTHFEKIFEISIPRIRVENQIITTYRDPELVAASWTNRQPGGFNPRNARRWVANWTRWKMFVEAGAQVFTMDDLSEHENRNPHPRKPTDIPYDLLNYAQECADAFLLR